MNIFYRYLFGILRESIKPHMLLTPFTRSYRTLCAHLTDGIRCQTLSPYYLLLVLLLPTDTSHHAHLVDHTCTDTHTHTHTHTHMHTHTHTCTHTHTHTHVLHIGDRIKLHTKNGKIRLTPATCHIVNNHHYLIFTITRITNVSHYSTNSVTLRFQCWEGILQLVESTWSKLASV